MEAKPLWGVGAMANTGLDWLKDGRVNISLNRNQLTNIVKIL